MHRQELEAIFDRNALSYDAQWSKLAPLRDTLQLLIAALLTDLRDDARILCVGAGTGEEMVDLARRRPRWTFTAVEPSAAMLDVCRRKAEEGGFADRCVFHAGYLDSLPPAENFDAATALLVSQFILDRTTRRDFFHEIGERLRPGGWLISSDLMADTRSAEYRSLAEVWWRAMRAADAPPDGFERMLAAYERDVAILPFAEVAAIIASGGFAAPVEFFQAGLIHAWFARRQTESAGTG
jgi:tRNA (cmo5U34)-methyltransferase